MTSPPSSQASLVLTNLAPHPVMVTCRSLVLKWRPPWNSSSVWKFPEKFWVLCRHHAGGCAQCVASTVRILLCDAANWHCHCRDDPSGQHAGGRAARDCQAIRCLTEVISDPSVVPIHQPALLAAMDANFSCRWQYWRNIHTSLLLHGD